MDDLTQRALSNQNTAAANYNQKALAPPTPATTGFYVGYVNGNHLIRLNDGGEIPAEPDSNGAAFKGDRVSIQQARGATPRFKVMPR